MVETYECALTTIDNPYDPFTDFEHWFLFDVENGYDSCSLVGRIAKTSDEFTDEENFKEIERAIDSIINNIDVQGIYIKVKREVEIP